jgi:hypothetical protein
MTVPVQTLHAKAPRPHRDGSAPSRARPPAPLLPGLFFLLTTLSAPALASGNESWASDTIEHMRQHAYNSATGARPRGRRSAVEGLDSYMIDEVQIRPRQHARRHDRTEEYVSPRRARVHRERVRKLASLGRHSQPVATAPVAEAAAAETPKASETPAPPPSGQVVASLGPTPPPPAPPKVSGGPINWAASPNCLANPLRTVLSEVAALFGAVRVNSTCRSKAHNARVGGASRSYHLTGNAVDFRVAANTASVSRFLLAKKTVGGFKHYGFGLFHIDTGPRRTWDGGPGRRAWASNRRSRRG